MTDIEIADTVHHGPTGEDWIVARVDDRFVWPAGWPPGRADKADCVLVKKATEEKRDLMICRLRNLPESDERRPVER